MSNYGITGWSGGGRRPITNNLRAGQFRQMGVPRNVSSNIFINNNFGCMGSYNDAYFDGCCGNNDSGMSKFEKWMLGLGIGGGFLGCILGAFGKGKSEGAGDTGETTDKAKTDEFAQLKNLYKDDKYTFAKIGDKYICKMGNDEVEGSSIEDLHAQIKAKRQAAQQPATQTTQETPATTTTPAETETGHKLADFNWENFDVTKLTDDQTGPLTMQAKNDTSVSEDHGSNVDAPKTITVSRNGKTYKFELVDDKSKISSDGHPMYKCTSNGKGLSENQIQEYYLKPDGEFYQNKQTAGYGTALGRNLPSSTEGAGSSDETPTRTAKPAQSKPSSSAKPATAKPAAAKPASTTATQQATPAKTQQAAPAKTKTQIAREKRLSFTPRNNIYDINVGGKAVGHLSRGGQYLNHNARFTIDSGKMKGNWFLEYKDGDYVDYSDVSFSQAGRFYNANRIMVNTHNKYGLDKISDPSTGKSYPAKYDGNNGTVSIQIDGQWIPLEDAMRM